ncbi:HpcH/HpaI aldolase family protein [Thalassoglobus sp.]|uniref:HpcH/HpaI aldolase family protein n=1 Tax=Thalassoglobus sp. TaxID=2795869 RepID=UPI003AA832BB
MANNFRSQLIHHELLLGTMVTLTTPATSEILAELGFDWLFIDGEHGPLETGDVGAILQAVGHRLGCVVRVPAVEEVPIKKVLDLGADGVIVPMVNTVEDAKNVVSWSRYAPMGSRGVGLARAHGYGLKFGDYVENANDRIAVIVQAEHYQSVENIESIVNVEGIDAVQVGPYDLAASMGKMGQVDDPEVVEAINHVIQTCQNAKIPIGWFGVTGEAVQPYIERGCTLITAGVDTLIFASAAKELLTSLR